MARDISPNELYQDKIVKLIPTEIVGAYVFISTGILGVSPAPTAAPYDLETKVWMLVISIVLLALTPVYVWSFHGVTSFPQLLVTTISFTVWVYSLGGPFAVWEWGYSPKVAGSILVLWSLITPLLVKPTAPSPEPSPDPPR